MNRKGIFTGLLICLLAMAFPLSGCASLIVSPSSNPSEEETIILTDDLDREVELERPKRVAVLIGSFADALSDAGGKDLIVAAAHDTWTSFDLDLDESVSDLGEVKNISVETLASLDMPVVYYDVSSFDDYCRILEQFTQITEDQNAYKKNVEDQSRIIGEIQKRYVDAIDNPSAIAVRLTGKGSSLLGANDSVMGEMLEDLNVSNLAGEKTQKEYSMESLIQEQPDFIFFTAQGKDNETAQQMADEFFSEPKWQQLNAVKDEKVYVMDSKFYNLKPNAQWASALAHLETIVYGK